MTEDFELSPFSLVSSPETAYCWAGRAETLTHLKLLVSGFSSRADSTLDVVWANLGAGKTHSLYHLSRLLTLRRSDIKCIPVVVEMPEQARNFLDLYRSIVASISIALLQELSSSVGLPRLSSDLFRVLNVIAVGSEGERDLAMMWLMAGRPHLSDLKRVIGVSERIETDLRAAEVLSALIRALSIGKMRLVVMLDEYQRVTSMRPASRTALLSSLRTIFSKNPTHLSLVFSVMSQVEKTALDLVPMELRTLLGRRPPITLPEFTPSEAFDFVRSRFLCFRPDNFDGSGTAPFTEDAVRFTIAHLEQANAPLIPRELLGTLGWVYDFWRSDDEVADREASISVETVERSLRVLTRS